MAGCQRQKKRDLEGIKRWIREDKSRLNTQAAAQDTLNQEQKRDQGKNNNMCSQSK